MLGILSNFDEAVVFAFFPTFKKISFSMLVSEELCSAYF